MISPENTAGVYALSYFLYVLIAVVFAVLAAIGVKMFAPYACGSGIPEVSSHTYHFLLIAYDKSSYAL